MSGFFHSTTFSVDVTQLTLTIEGYVDLESCDKKKAQQDDENKSRLISFTYSDTRPHVGRMIVFGHFPKLEKTILLQNFIPWGQQADEGIIRV